MKAPTGRNAGTERLNRFNRGCQSFLQSTRVCPSGAKAARGVNLGVGLMEPLLADKTADRQLRLGENLDIQFAALRLVQSVELCSHKLHAFLPGPSPMPVCFHKRQQVFEAVPGE